MDKELIIAILAIIGGIITNWVKTNQSEKKFTVREALLKDRIDSLELTSNKLEKQLANSQEGEMFRMRFRDEIAKKVSTKVNNSEILQKTTEIFNIYSNLLTEFGKDLAEFGIKFYYSDFRYSKVATKLDFRRLLSDDMDNIMSQLFTGLKTNVKKEKAFNLDNRIVCIDLVQFIVYRNEKLKIPGSIKRAELLIERLIQNGFIGTQGQQDLLEYFLNFTDEFIDLLKNCIKEFDKLEGYDEYIEKTL